jgi:nucleotide-binding universal stress UspA family protein
MIKHLLVTLDGTPRSEAVISHAIDVARSMGTTVTLLRVVDEAGANWSERGALGKSNSAATIRSLFTEQAQSYLQRIAAQMKAAGVDPRLIVKQGQAATQILRTVKEVDADAIAMATHSRRGINRLMFGSVAEQVLHESSLPVLLIRAG